MLRSGEALADLCQLAYSDFGCKVQDDRDNREEEPRGQRKSAGITLSQGDFEI